MVNIYRLVCVIRYREEQIKYRVKYCNLHVEFHCEQNASPDCVIQYRNLEIYYIYFMIRAAVTKNHEANITFYLITPLF